MKHGDLLEELRLVCEQYKGFAKQKLGKIYEKTQALAGEFLNDWKSSLIDIGSIIEKLLAYKEAPSEELVISLSPEFDILFSTKTGYAVSDERISKTKAKKGSLLLVLKFPEIPLHNNESELGARQQARKRDVSLHTMVSEGTKANDTFLSIVETCKKLGINCYDLPLFMSLIQRTLVEFSSNWRKYSSLSCRASRVCR